jgi:hypothetical protein
MTVQGDTQWKEYNCIDNSARKKRNYGGTMAELVSWLESSASHESINSLAMHLVSWDLPTPSTFDNLGI